MSYHTIGDNDLCPAMELWSYTRSNTRAIHSSHMFYVTILVVFCCSVFICISWPAEYVITQSSAVEFDGNLNELAIPESTRRWDYFAIGIREPNKWHLCNGTIDGGVSENYHTYVWTIRQVFHESHPFLCLDTTQSLNWKVGFTTKLCYILMNWIFYIARR